VGSKSDIEWTDATWPVVQGCDYASPGCSECYAVRAVNRQAYHPNPKLSEPVQGLVAPRNGKLRWTGKVALRHDRLDWPLTWKKPRMIFVPSLGDLFHEDVPFEFVDKVVAVIKMTPYHTYQVLTKRADRQRDYMRSRFETIGGADGIDEAIEERCAERGWCPPTPSDDVGPPANMWCGVTVENQTFADIRVPALLDTPAAVRFLSMEPLLTPVALRYEWMAAHHTHLDWVIVGGESGNVTTPWGKARAMVETIIRPFGGEPVWVPKREAVRTVASLRDQCVAAGVPFFFKQWGGPTSKAAGRTLQGREWSQMPILKTAA